MLNRSSNVHFSKREICPGGKGKNKHLSFSLSFLSPGTNGHFRQLGGGSRQEQKKLGKEGSRRSSDKLSPLPKRERLRWKSLLFRQGIEGGREKAS